MISKIFEKFLSPGRPKIIFVMLVILPLSAFAASLEIDADRQLEYADHLFSAGDFDRASDEYERFIFFFPEDPRVLETILQRGRSLYKNAQYKKAINTLDALVSHKNLPLSESSDTGVAAYILISNCYIEMGMPGQAVNTLNNLYLLAETPELRDEVLYRIGWLYTEFGQWGPAHSAFHRINPDRQGSYRVKEIMDGLGRVEAIPRKNPTAAGALALVPGGGYLYCERYQDALVAFILNGGLMAGAWKAFDSDNPALGGLLSLVGIGFYTGSIYGSVNSAKKYNRRQTRRFVDKLKEETRISLVPLVREKGAMLSFQFAF